MQSYECDENENDLSTCSYQVAILDLAPGETKLAQSTIHHTRGSLKKKEERTNERERKKRELCQKLQCGKEEEEEEEEEDQQRNTRVRE